PSGPDRVWWFASRGARNRPSRRPPVPVMPRQQRVRYGGDASAFAQGCQRDRDLRDDHLDTSGLSRARSPLRAPGRPRKGRWCRVTGMPRVPIAATLVLGFLLGLRHAHEHEHDGVQHAHLHLHAATHRPGAGHGAAHVHPHPLRAAVRPFLIGSLHGLAGTGALVLLVLTTLPGVLVGLAYIGLFGAGSVAGMALMSLAL